MGNPFLKIRFAHKTFTESVNHRNHLPRADRAGVPLLEIATVYIKSSTRRYSHWIRLHGADRGQFSRLCHRFTLASPLLHGASSRGSLVVQIQRRQFSPLHPCFTRASCFLYSDVLGGLDRRRTFSQAHRQLAASRA